MSFLLNNVHDEECSLCGQPHYTSGCPIISLGQRIRDKPIPPKAKLTLPDKLDLRMMSRLNKPKVLAKERISCNTQFGPLEAPEVSIDLGKNSSIYMVFENDHEARLLDTSNYNLCNWMSLVTFSNVNNQNNMVCYQFNQSIYFCSIKDINPGDELIVAYSNSYRKKIECYWMNNFGDNDIQMLDQNYSAYRNFGDDNENQIDSKDHLAVLCLENTTLKAMFCGKTQEPALDSVEVGRNRTRNKKSKESEKIVEKAKGKSENNPVQNSKTTSTSSARSMRTRLDTKKLNSLEKCLDMDDKLQRKAIVLLEKLNYVGKKKSLRRKMKGPPLRISNVISLAKNPSVLDEFLPKCSLKDLSLSNIAKKRKKFEGTNRNQNAHSETNVKIKNKTIKDNSKMKVPKKDPIKKTKEKTSITTRKEKVKVQNYSKQKQKIELIKALIKKKKSERKERLKAAEAHCVTKVSQPIKNSTGLGEKIGNTLMIYVKAQKESDASKENLAKTDPASTIANLENVGIDHSYTSEPVKNGEKIANFEIKPTADEETPSKVETIAEKVGQGKTVLRIETEKDTLKALETMQNSQTKQLENNEVINVAQTTLQSKQNSSTETKIISSKETETLSNEKPGFINLKNPNENIADMLENTNDSLLVETNPQPILQECVLNVNMEVTEEKNMSPYSDVDDLENDNSSLSATSDQVKVTQNQEDIKDLESLLSLIKQKIPAVTMSPQTGDKPEVVIINRKSTEHTKYANSEIMKDFSVLDKNKLINGNSVDSNFQTQDEAVAIIPRKISSSNEIQQQRSFDTPRQVKILPSKRVPIGGRIEYAYDQVSQRLVPVKSVETGGQTKYVPLPIEELPPLAKKQTTKRRIKEFSEVTVFKSPRGLLTESQIEERRLKEVEKEKMEENKKLLAKELVEKFGVQAIKADPKIKIWNCTVCDTVFEDCVELAFHLKTHFEHAYCLDDDERDVYKNFSCCLCRKKYEGRTRIHYHLRSHTIDFYCSLCQKAFNSESIEKFHKCSANPKEFLCKYCSKALSTRTSLLQHEYQHKKEPKFSCETCGRKFYFKSKLKNHSCKRRNKYASLLAEDHNNEDGPYTCKVCDKVFHKKRTYLSHVPMHTGEYECQYCGRWLGSKLSLTQHIVVCSTRNVRRFSMTDSEKANEDGSINCSYCHENFTNVLDYRRHYYGHSYPHECQICGNRFRNNLELKNHKCVYLEFRCKICDQTFSTFLEMKNHRLEQNHINPPLIDEKELEELKKTPHICDICGGNYLTSQKLRFHRLLHMEKKFTCDICHKKFLRKSDMLTHRDIHGAPKVKCPYCPKLMKQLKSLQPHIRWHERTFKFSCHLCAKKFSQKGNLLKHLDAHDVEKRYYCQYCPKDFAAKDNLRNHEIIHERGKMFKCQTCGSAFIKPHFLAKHIKTIHGDDSYMCKYCGVICKAKPSILRHLLRKHPNRRNEWKSEGFVDKMYGKHKKSNDKKLYHKRKLKKEVDDSDLEDDESYNSQESSGEETQDKLTIKDKDEALIETHPVHENEIIVRDTQESVQLAVESIEEETYVVEEIPTQEELANGEISTAENHEHTYCSEIPENTEVHFYQEATDNHEPENLHYQIQTCSNDMQVIYARDGQIYTETNFDTGQVYIVPNAEVVEEVTEEHVILDEVEYVHATENVMVYVVPTTMQNYET